MPVYEYKCQKCERVFEFDDTVGDTREQTHDFHPHLRKLCENKVLKRVFSFALRPVPGAGGSPGRY